MRKILFLIPFLFAIPCAAQVNVSGSQIQIGGVTGGVTSTQGTSPIQVNGVSGSPQTGAVTVSCPSCQTAAPIVYLNELVGAFTDPSGNVIEPIAIGNGPVSFVAPTGTTQLQLGGNDDIFSDEGGSWTISVNGTNYTVGGKAAPWLNTGTNATQYPTGPSGNIAPIVVTVSAGSLVTIQYVSGLVTTSEKPAGVDANGNTSVIGTGSGASGHFFPGHWVVDTSSNVTSVSNSDGSLTFSPTTGPVVGSINYAHAGTWTALETFNAGVSIPSGQGVTQTTGGSPANCWNTAGTTTLCGGGSGGSVSVNGSAVSSPNFNGATPAAPANSVNGTFAVSGSSVSVSVPNTTTVNGVGCVLGSACTISAGTTIGVQHTFTFAGAGSQVFTHNLGIQYPFYSCATTSGAQFSPTWMTWTDANNVTMTAPAATVTVCNFGQSNTATSLSNPAACPDASGSGTAQSCTTTPTITVAANACIAYSTTTGNTGTALTLAVNGGAAAPVAISGNTGWTTALLTSPQSIPPNRSMLACFDGADWDVQQTGTAASGLPQGVPQYCTWGGTANAFTATCPNRNTALTPGLTVLLLTPSGQSNSGSVTLNVDGLGAKTVQKLGVNLQTNDLPSSQVEKYTYDGTNFQLDRISPVAIYSNGDKLAIGNGSVFNDATVVGIGASAGGSFSGATVFGANASGGGYTVSIGPNASEAGGVDVAIGYFAGGSDGNPSASVFIGQQANHFGGTGIVSNNSVMIGNQSGYTGGTTYGCASCVYIGASTHNSSASGLTDAIAIGSSATVSANGHAVIGDTGITDVYMGSESPAAKVHDAGVMHKTYTVSTLPACSSTVAGWELVATDATSPTYLGALTGGGTVLTPVVCSTNNGTTYAWASY